jgi:hypothetical protein
VLGADGVVAERAGFILGEHDDLARCLVETLEHEALISPAST